MRWKVKRIKGKKICYWLKKANVLIIDHGNENGSIHIYEHLISTSAGNLKTIIDEFVGNDDIASKSYLEVNELVDNKLFDKLFTYQIKKK